MKKLKEKKYVKFMKVADAATKIRLARDCNFFFRQKSQQVLIFYIQIQTGTNIL
jgi:hypothetical protein